MQTRTEITQGRWIFSFGFCFLVSCGARKINSAEVTVPVITLSSGNKQNLEKSPFEFQPNAASRLNGSFEQPVLQQNFTFDSPLWELKNNQWISLKQKTSEFQSTSSEKGKSDSISVHFTSQNSLWARKKNGIVWEDLIQPVGQQYAEVDTLELLKDANTSEILLAQKNKLFLKQDRKLILFERVENTIRASVLNLPESAMGAAAIAMGIQGVGVSDASLAPRELWFLNKESYFLLKKQSDDKWLFKGTKIQFDETDPAAVIHMLNREAKVDQPKNFWVITKKGLFGSSKK